MTAKIQKLPEPWAAGATHNVVVEISGATIGTSLSVGLWRTEPSPRQELGEKTVNVDGNGNAIAVFSVALSVPGINVVHCEAAQGGSFHSGSSGTVVQ